LSPESSAKLKWRQTRTAQAIAPREGLRMTMVIMYDIAAPSVRVADGALIDGFIA